MLTTVKHDIDFEISEKLPIAKSLEVNEVLLPFPEVTLSKILSAKTLKIRQGS